MKHDFLTLKDISRAELIRLLDRSAHFKNAVKFGQCPQPLAGKVLGLIFEKSSTRTRVSFEVAILKLGGHGIYLNQDMSQLGRGETYADTARVLSRYMDVMVLRTYSHKALEELASHATVPVINGLTDTYHPCQLLADLMTMREKGKELTSAKVAYIGDGNNMTNSWIQAAEILGFPLAVACPEKYGVDPAIMKSACKLKNVSFTCDPQVAAKDADVIYTDTWFSMGQEEDHAKRQAFNGFQINDALVQLAVSDALVMHCLPAHREEEITDAVMDGPRSVVFDEAENRLYAQMAVLEMLVGG